MSNLKCIVVDDEPLALKLIENFASQTPFIELVATCDNALDVIKLLKTVQADLLFLDINMPQFSGMELARWIQQQPQQSLPRIVFTTAYNHYAIEGYKVNAVDYLLKPFGYEDFLRAATKALQLTESSSRQPVAQEEDDAIFVKVEYQWIKVYYDDILFIEGLKDYVKFHLASQEKTILSLVSLKALEERLPPAMFMRVHRSFIVSLKKISSITKNSLIINQKEITIGEQYRETFKNMVEKWLM